ncbi:MAG TPA: hypothetical protein VHX36_06925 [Candidatus Acidoferrales bacterium]|jgi:hypothetical protein|nr:hypothetical protein [Candidatus Acidoferrales bacterium]
MSESSELSRWIDQLADPDPAQRAAAAEHLYREGASLFSSAAAEWMQHPEFRALVRPGGCIVGVAVGPAAFDAIRAANASPHLADVPPDQDAKEFELDLAGGHFDILTTRVPGGSGAIARYLAKFGAGIQQIELNVIDVDRATEILRVRFAVAPLYPATRPGADGTRVNFFLVPAPGKKALIELVEKAK